MLKNISGQQVGLWLVGNTFMKGIRRYYKCTCLSCGSEKNVRADSLLSGGTNACSKCVLTKRNKESATHRATKTKLYRLWSGMKARIKDDEKNYLFLGIKICDEWKNFEPFRDWAISSGYRSGLTIERKNPLGDYKPENCTFITNKDQQANKLNTIRLSDGSMAWLTAQINGISRNAFDNRRRRGWSVEDACTRPIRTFAPLDGGQG